MSADQAQATSDRARAAAEVLSNLGSVQSLVEFRAEAGEFEFTPDFRTFPDIADLPDFDSLTKSGPMAYGGLIFRKPLKSPERPAGGLTRTEMQSIVDQALLLIEQFYVHLGLKQAMHAVDPVQSLKLLRLRLDQFATDQAFHNAMISIFKTLRDVHTNYILPEPYKSRAATLPFQIEEYFEDGLRRYVVTKVSPLVDDPHFQPGVIPTHWNGVPIDRAVQINAEREAGSNEAARHAHGLASLTVRWMGTSLPPDEDWVSLRYLDGDVTREATFEWTIFQPGKPASGVDTLAAMDAAAMRLGVDTRSEIQRRVKKLLFSPEAVATEQKMASGSAAESLGTAHESALPDAFPVFKDVKTAHGEFAYIRIATFNVNDEPFLKEFIRILGLLSRNGLILDVRGNGGGNIYAGERLLQLLTPHPIQPAQFSFASTPLVQKLCELVPKLNPWVNSIVQSTEIGANYSRGLPLTPVDACNAIGQRYQGPVVLVTDALCYSTTDMFAAGFQDHGIGPILGVSDRTGAGGANVWTYDLLRSKFDASDTPLPALPRGSTFRLALRRAVRSGRYAGDLLEDLGVSPDYSYRITRNDVLNGNVDMINAAAKLLAEQPVSSLRVHSVFASPKEGLTVAATTKNLDRLDLLVAGRPLTTLDIGDGKIDINLPSAAAQGVLEIKGYRDGDLRVAVRIDVGGQMDKA